jgi:hypothetical protein
MLTNDQFRDLQAILNDGYKMLIWKNSSEAPMEFLEKKGYYGAAFWNAESEDQPECSEDCEYGHTAEMAILNAIRRWR